MLDESHLCPAAELLANLGEPNLRVIDASWYMPAAARDTQQEFDQQHVPGAVFFDIDKICDTNSELPHMLPSAEQFGEAVGELGISNDSDIIVYDTAGLFSAARVWWMFKSFGHRRVRVLDGGMPAWVFAGGELSSTAAAPRAVKYTANLDGSMLASKALLIENSVTAAYLVLDARSRDRFYGRAPEPRPGLSAGHMPNSVSLPFDQLLDDGKLKSREQLLTILHNNGVSQDSQIITTCGSGVTAAIITLALAETGFGLHQLYDGAWSEWASATDTVILDSNYDS